MTLSNEGKIIQFHRLYGQTLIRFGNTGVHNFINLKSHMEYNDLMAANNFELQNISWITRLPLVMLVSADILTSFHKIEPFSIRESG